MIQCFNCDATFGISGADATAGEKRALSEHLEACLPLARWTQAREYVVSLQRLDSSGAIRDVVVYAYTAADAVTQMEILQQCNYPRERVHRVNPR